MRVFSLFPSPLVEFKISNNLNQLNKEVEKQTFEETSDFGSESSKSFNVLSQCRNIENIILNCFYQYAQESLKLDTKFKISTSWYTKIKKGCSCQYHHHKNCFYSGVLYFGHYKREDDGYLCFLTPLDKLSDYFIKPVKENLLNTGISLIPPENGKLIFFPSYLSHRVGQYNGDNPRYSLAFNIVPVGKYGEGDSSMEIR